MIKSKQYLNLFFLIKFFLIYLIIGFYAFAENSKKLENLIVLGTDDAPVKIKIFSSLTCPHCASFHINVLPKINKNYVKSGKVQLIFIDFPLDQVAFNASKLLHCLEQKNQITFLDDIYEKQSEWNSGSNIDEINNNLKNMVKNLGINSEKFDNCINNEAIGDKIITERINGQEKYSIKSTPTIIINEKKLEGSANFKNIKKRIEKLI